MTGYDLGAYFEGAMTFAFAIGVAVGAVVMTLLYFGVPFLARHLSIGWN